MPCEFLAGGDRREPARTRGANTPHTPNTPSTPHTPTGAAISCSRQLAGTGSRRLLLRSAARGQLPEAGTGHGPRESPGCCRAPPRSEGARLLPRAAACLRSSRPASDPHRAHRRAIPISPASSCAGISGTAAGLLCSPVLLPICSRPRRAGCCGAGPDTGQVERRASCSLRRSPGRYDQQRQRRARAAERRQQKTRPCSHSTQPPNRNAGGMICH